MQSDSQPDAVLVPNSDENDSASKLIAVQAVAVWRDIDTALAPIIGRLGVAVLYRRCLRAIAAVDPWLEPAVADSTVIEHSIRADELAALHAALAAQTDAVAQGAQDRLLESFHQLLASLIGTSLTEGLIGFTRNRDLQTTVRAGATIGEDKIL